MELFRSIKDTLKKVPMTLMALCILILSISIFSLALSLSSFTNELSFIRKDLPGLLNRIDGQIKQVQKSMKEAENTGVEFQTGVNKGISQGVVDVPLGTVTNVGNKLSDTAASVGYKLSDTAASTGKQTLGFWQGFKDKVMFWDHKKTTPEAAPVNEPYLVLGISSAVSAMLLPSLFTK